MDAFATYAELAARLNRTFTVPEQAWVTTLLGDASTYLRDDVLGLQVFPQSQSTFIAYPDGGRIDFPQAPVVSIDSVKVNGVAQVLGTGYNRRDDSIYVSCDGPVEVKFTYGYLTAPESLKRWACVLVSSALLPLEQNLGLTVGGLSSIALDDFKVAFADAGELSGMTLSDRNIKLLRDQFGVRGSYVVTTR